MPIQITDTPHAAVPPVSSPARAAALPLPPVPVPAVDFLTFANCCRALHGASRS
jgi:hypothetical protein